MASFGSDNRLASTYRGPRQPFSPQTRRPLQRAQKVQQILLGRIDEAVEVVDDRIGLGCLVDGVRGAAMLPNRLHEIARTAVVQEEDALPETPQRRGSELVAARATLRYVIGETRPHIVQGDVGVQVRDLVAQCLDRGDIGCPQTWRVAERTADLREFRASATDRVRRCAQE